MKNNKGFSLIEILATIVIIGIVSTVGIVSVNSMINKSKQHFYESQKQQMVLAAQSYVQDNRNILPRNVGGMIKIKLSVLREKNYLKEDIIDQDKNVCDQDNSYVTVYKNNQTEYKYHGYLDCPACKKNGAICYKDDGELKPVISIDFPDTNNQGNALFNKNKKISIIMKATNDDDHPTIKIASYSYKIYVDNVLKYDSGIKIDNKRITYTATEDIYKYVPGKIKVVATLTNTDGSTTSQTVVKDFKDMIKPQCGRVTYEGVKVMNPYDTQSGTLPKCGEAGYPWININSSPNNRVAWIVCNDVEGIGCAQHEFSQNFTSDGHDDDIKIRDKKGNEDTCKVKKCIDRTSSNITFSFYVADPNGKPKGNPVQTYTASPQSTQYTYVKEESYPNWLNEDAYPDGVYIKVKVNDPTSDIQSFTWKINPKNQTVSNAEPANTTIKTKSNLVNGEVGYLIKDDGVRNQEIKVVDKAGNTAILKVYMKIDRTDPTCNNVSGHKSVSKTDETESTEEYKSTYWSGRAKVYTWPTCSDSISGCYPSWYKVKVTRGTGSSADTGTFTQTKRGLKSQGVSYHDWIIKDEAANTTNCSQFTIKLDRTDPDCTEKKTTTDSTDGVDGYINCSDTHSGCDKDNHYYTFSDLQTDGNDDKTYDYVIKDIVGNKKTCKIKVTRYKQYRYHKKYSSESCSTTKWCISNSESNCSASHDAYSSSSKGCTIVAGGYGVGGGVAYESCTSCTTVYYCYSSGHWTDWGASSNGCGSDSRYLYK